MAISNRRPVGRAGGETRLQTLSRMLAKARAERMKLYRFASEDGVYIAISTGARGAYMVRPGDVQNGCTCDGYRRHMYCKHYAAACYAHGFPVPEPEEPKLLFKGERVTVAEVEARSLVRDSPKCRVCETAPIVAGDMCDECGDWWARVNPPDDWRDDDELEPVQ